VAGWGAAAPPDAGRPPGRGVLAQSRARPGEPAALHRAGRRAAAAGPQAPRRPAVAGAPAAAVGQQPGHGRRACRVRLRGARILERRTAAGRRQPAAGRPGRRGRAAAGGWAARPRAGPGRGAPPRAVIVSDRPERKEIMAAAGHAVPVSHPDKTYFPRTGHTKLDLVRYYLSVADGALGGVAGRPMVLKRYVNGADVEPFFQKRAPSPRPDW